MFSCTTSLTTNNGLDMCQPTKTDCTIWDKQEDIQEKTGAKGEQFGISPWVWNKTKSHSRDGQCWKRFRNRAVIVKLAASKKPMLPDTQKILQKEAVYYARFRDPGYNGLAVAGQDMNALLLAAVYRCYL